MSVPISRLLSITIPDEVWRHISETIDSQEDELEWILDALRCYSICVFRHESACGHATVWQRPSYLRFSSDEALEDYLNRRFPLDK